MATYSLLLVNSEPSALRLGKVSKKQGLVLTESCGGGRDVRCGMGIRLRLCHKVNEYKWDGLQVVMTLAVGYVITDQLYTVKYSWFCQLRLLLLWIEDEISIIYHLPWQSIRLTHFYFILLALFYFEICAILKVKTCLQILFLFLVQWHRLWVPILMGKESYFWHTRNLSICHGFGVLLRLLDLRGWSVSVAIPGICKSQEEESSL